MSFLAGVKILKDKFNRSSLEPTLSVLFSVEIEKISKNTKAY
jgi:hypothetical protein